MNRQVQRTTALLLLVITLGTGCRPQQPFFFGEDGSLSRYVGKATEISKADVEKCANPEADDARAPLTLANANFDETWPLSLQDAVKHALANGKVLRSLGGRFAVEGSPTSPILGPSPNLLLTNPLGANTIYDPSIQGSSLGIDGAPIGEAAALSAYDAEFTSSLTWQKTDEPTNIAQLNPNTGLPTGNPVEVQQSLGTFQAQIAKVTAEGTRFYAGSDTNYNQTKGTPFGQLFFPSYFTQNVAVGFNQPLLQGAGVQFNEIAGPYNPFQGIGSKVMDGVVLARINNDISLADFEAGVRNMVFDVENAYWELFFAYHNLDTSKQALQSSLKTWQRVKTLGEAGLAGGAAADEAMAREQFYAFKALMEVAKSELFGAETRLRYMMGISVSDGRLIRPSDEPTSAKVSFNWNEVLGEGLERSVELRKQKWVIKERELELIAAKNFLLPRLDANGAYRWHGFGHDLINPDSGGKPPFDNAFQSLMGGDFQEWDLGLQMSIKLGFRAELADVRHHQLLLTRAKALLQEQELELSHQMGDAIRALDEFHMVTETNFNRRMAAQHQVESLQAVFNAGVASANGSYVLDLLLQAQRRLAEAEGAYYRSLVDYTRSIAQLHFRKGSLLEYNGVYLAEGPWPAKAYFDAMRLARQRDASLYIDYGYTRPKVFSRGPYEQFQDSPEGVPAGTQSKPHNAPKTPSYTEPENVAPPAAEGTEDQQANRGGAQRTATVQRTARPTSSRAAAQSRAVPAGYEATKSDAANLDSAKTNSAKSNIATTDAVMSRTAKYEAARSAAATSAATKSEGGRYEWGSLGLKRSSTASRAEVAPVSHVQEDPTSPDEPAGNRSPY
ncbi:MAG: TolC family protein [Planctomycetia bacterium]|nr:TolC family protein [Planctomycetia bacterium]